MSDLVAFLNARLDEDEAVARQAESDWPGGDSESWPSMDERAVCLSSARMLREVEAKRHIFAMAQRSPDRPGLGRIGLAMFSQGVGLGLALRALAAVYSDHRDYDQAWT